MGFGYGVLVGLGIGLVLLSIMGYGIALSIHQAVEAQRKDIEEMYSLINSPVFSFVRDFTIRLQTLAKSLEKYSWVLSKVGINTSRLYSNAFQVQEQLDRFKKSVNTLYSELTSYKLTSEIAATSTIELIAGTALIAVGAALEVRARRKAKP